MAELGEENVVGGVFGGVEFDGNNGDNNNQNDNLNQVNAGTINNVYGKGSSNNLPTKAGFWSKFKGFWLQDVDLNKEIKVVLTPYQQKVEDEINDFLHQEITWDKVRNFLFQEVSFGKKKEA